MVTIDQFLEALGSILLGVVGFFLNRELTKVDENHKELEEYCRELSSQIHGIDTRLSVAESQLDERERRR